MNNVIGRFFLIILLVLCIKTAHAQTGEDVQAIRQRLSASKADTTRVNTLLVLGRFYLDKPGEVKSDLDSALLLSAQGRKLSYSLRYDPGVGRSFLLDGQVYHERGNKDLSWKTNQKALDFFVAHQMPFEAGEAYRAFAVFF